MFLQVITRKWLNTFWGTIKETITKDLEVNELDLNMVYDQTWWCNLIHVANFG